MPKNEFDQFDDEENAFDQFDAASYPVVSTNRTQVTNNYGHEQGEPKKSLYERIAPDVKGGLRDLLPSWEEDGGFHPGQIVGGARDAAQGVANLGNSADNWVASKLGYWPAVTAGNGEDGFQLSDLVPRIVNKKHAPEGLELPQVSRSEHVTGNVGRGVTQFAGGYAGAARALPSAVGKLNAPVRGIVRGGVGEFFTFDGDTPRLSDIAPENFGGVAAPVIDALRTKEGDGELVGRLKNVAEGGILGAGIEGIAAGVRGGYRVARGGDLRPHASGISRSEIRNAPDVDELRARRDAAYKEADESGARYSDEGFADTVGKIESRLAGGHFDARTHTATAGIVRKLHEFVGESPTLQQLEGLRQRVSRDLLAPQQGSAVTGSDQHFGRAIIEEIDGLIGRQGAIVTGGADETLQTIRTARESHGVLKRAELIEDAMTRAKDRAAASGSGGNLENAMRGEIRRILHSDKLKRGFSEAEISEMRNFVRGGKLQNILRGYGKLSPVGSGLMAAIGTGSAATNPSTLPVFLGAIGARTLADRGSRKAAAQLGELVRSRPVGQAAAAPQGGQSALRSLLSARGGRTSAVDKPALAGGAAVIAGSGQANAQEQNALHLTQEVDQLGERITGLESSVEDYERELEAFSAMSVSEKQLYLRDTYGKNIRVDGEVGPQTAGEIEALKEEIGGRIASARGEIDAARNRRNDMEIRLVNLDNDPSNPYIEKGVALGAGALGLYGAHRFRARNLRASATAARNIEDEANALITGLPVPPSVPDRTLKSRLPVVGRADREAHETAVRESLAAREALDRGLAGQGRSGFPKSGVNSLEARAANLNEYYSRGGASADKLPIRHTADGGLAERKRGVLEASNLYEPRGRVGSALRAVGRSVRTPDVAVSAGGGIDAAMMQPILESAQADKEQALQDLERAQAARDPIGIAEAKERLNKAEQIESVALGAQRLGFGLMAGGALGAFQGRYASARPRVEAATRERSLIGQELARRARAKKSKASRPAQGQRPRLVRPASNDN